MEYFIDPTILANVLLAVSALSYGIPTVFGTVNFDDLRGFSNQPFPSANTSTNETIHLTTHDVIGESIKTSVDALLKQFYQAATTEMTESMYNYMA